MVEDIIVPVTWDDIARDPAGWPDRDVRIRLDDDGNVIVSIVDIDFPHRRPGFPVLLSPDEAVMVAQVLIEKSTASNEKGRSNET